MTITITESTNECQISEEFKCHSPEACLFNQDNIHVASLWWKSTWQDKGKSLGYIGHLNSTDQKEIKDILTLASNFLKDKHCDTIIGPINGNTWQKYRFVTWSDGSNPFLMEPENDRCLPEYFIENGFDEWQEYISTKRELSQSLNENSTIQFPDNVNIRSIDLTQFENELKKMYLLSADTFKDNILYTPVNEKDFVNLYLPLKEYIQTDFMKLLENNKKEIIAYIFAIPDLMLIKRGLPLDTIIIKTLAVRSDFRNQKLGGLLVKTIDSIALQKGITKVIHALMHSDNNSTKIGKELDIIRKYHLFKKSLS